MIAALAMAAALAGLYPVEEKSIADIKADLACGKVTSVELVKA